jgi:chromosome segregation protein
MQDVIFGGGRGVQARGSAEVEIVLDNADGGIDVPLGEISIVRRLDRSGEGEYRLNGARCRLVDVLELLSDTGLGKEMHSVVSQGRVEAIVTSKPKDRRLLIEEAAGLGKHRKRRRRAQLKLERTQDNLDRGARRGARGALAAAAAQAPGRGGRAARADRAPVRRGALGARARRRPRPRRGPRGGRGHADAARAARDETQAGLGAVAARRQAAEEALARALGAPRGPGPPRGRGRSAAERVELRLERTRETVGDARRAHRVPHARARRPARAGRAGPPDEHGPRADRGARAELERLDADRERALERELAALEAERTAALARVEALAEEAAAAARPARADAAAEDARRARREAEKAAEAARRDAAKTGAELARANQFLRSHASAPGGARALADELGVRRARARARRRPRRPA